MKDFYLFIGICLHFGPIFTNRVLAPCQSVPDGVCSRGQYLLIAEDNEHKCLGCPKDTYLDFESHNCGSCRPHTQPGVEEIISKSGSSTQDNVVTCREGFFRNPGVKGSCQSCSQCEGDKLPARACTEDQDTFCCSIGMKAVQQENGHMACVPSHSRLPRELQQLRKERSSAHSEHNATEENTGDNSGADKGHGQEIHGEDTHHSPDHSYVRADYETEYQHNKVEFPVWARILCAGVAVGVFLFYLGVGIPCNACGSRDKLRALRKRMFPRHEEAPTDEETKEKPTEKPKPSSEQV